jgi:Fic family protein
MVYVEKFKLKGRDYYRLVHNIRNKNKIIHKTKYLGRKTPKKQELDKVKKEFLKEINKEGTKYFSEKELEKIEKKKENYIQELKGLSNIEKKKRLEEFVIRCTYDSSKLSGVDITLRQTFLILQERIIPKEFKNLRIAKEIENHEKGFLMITKYKGIFDLRFIKRLHKILMGGVNEEISGRLRSELKRNVKIAGTPYNPPKWEELDKEIKNFFLWYKENNRKLHPLELAALIHLRLISMQLFVDGNSRLSRLLMNWVLWKKGYPLIDIPVEDLENYYNSLDYYQIEKDEKKFIKYILEKYLA